MKIYSEGENEEWLKKQARADIARRKYDQLTDNGIILIKTLLDIFISLSRDELERASGLKGEEFEGALRDALHSSLVEKDRNENYLINISYREFLAGIAHP